MVKKNFTLEDVENMIEEIGFEWVDRLVYNPNNEKYKSLKSNSFKKPIFMSLKNKLNGLRVLAMAEINNETFILKWSSAKLDVSEDWKENLNKLEKGI